MICIKTENLIFWKNEITMKEILLKSYNQREHLQYFQLQTCQNRKAQKFESKVVDQNKIWWVLLEKEPRGAWREKIENCLKLFRIVRFIKI